MNDIDNILARLAKSPFRQRFILRPLERDYLASKGLDTVRDHARNFVAKRLGPATLPNDGKQTPFRGHPVFVAQHATATCCRGCLAKWHAIPKGRAMENTEIDYAVAVIERWLSKQTNADREPQEPRLL
jgi:hypothetical protein